MNKVLNYKDHFGHFNFNNFDVEDGMETKRANKIRRNEL
ncbi:hypothetical protein DOJK_00213 [Patescibacteria group bacterium]|nr:hypothetical protein DOJK_00213 [Patescibacteria group bacterium]